MIIKQPINIIPNKADSYPLSEWTVINQVRDRMLYYKFGKLSISLQYLGHFFEYNSRPFFDIGYLQNRIKEISLLKSSYFLNLSNERKEGNLIN